MLLYKITWLGFFNHVESFWKTRLSETKVDLETPAGVYHMSAPEILRYSHNKSGPNGDNGQAQRLVGVVVKSHGTAGSIERRIPYTV